MARNARALLSPVARGRWLVWIAGLLALGAWAEAVPPAQAETAPPAQAEAAAPAPAMTAAEFEASLQRQQGDVKLPNGHVTLHLGTAYDYLGPADTERVLVQAWGNPPGNETQGMVLPAGMHPTDPAAWAIVLTYSDDGHVDDSDAEDIDYDALLKEMQEGTAAENAQRKEAGYAAMNLVGWAKPPHYDAAKHTLYWAKELAVEGAPEHTLNYSVRTLGRTGVLEMNFVASMAQLPQVEKQLAAVVALPEFIEGRRYIDFDPDVDEVAAYGLGALVAGKVAAKAGLLAAALLFLKKGWVLIAAGGAWLFTRLRGKAQSNASQPPPPPAA